MLGPTSKYVIILLIFILILFSLVITNSLALQTGYIRRIHITGNGTPSTYTPKNEPYYLFVDFPDLPYCLPNVNYLTRQVYYTYDSINDTLISYTSGNEGYLFILHGVNNTHNSFDIYYLDFTNGRSYYLGNLAKYGFYFPKFFYNGYTLIYGLSRITAGKLLLWVAVINNNEDYLHLILINTRGKSIEVVGNRTIHGRYMYIGKARDRYLLLHGGDDGFLHLIVANDPLFYRNESYNLSIKAPRMIPDHTREPISMNNTIWIVQHYWKCPSPFVSGKMTIYLFMLNLPEINRSKIYVYINSSVRDFENKFMGPYIINDTLYYLTMDQLLWTDLSIDPLRTSNLSVIMYSNVSIPGQAIYRFNYPYLFVLKTTNNSDNLESWLSSVTIYNIKQKQLIDNISLSFIDKQYIYYDPIGSMLKPLNRSLSTLIIPYYLYNEKNGLLGYGLEYLLFHNGLYVGERNILLYNLSEWSIYKGAMNNEIELYSRDLDGDKAPKTILIHKAVFLNNSYSIDIYVINDHYLFGVKPLPEPWILPFLLLASILFAFLLKHVKGNGK